MRHSRKSAQSVTVAFYSGELTSFERRLEICLAAFQPVLEQLHSPAFLQSLPAPAVALRPALKEIDTPPFRVQGNSGFSRRRTESEKETVPDSPILSITIPPTPPVREPSADSNPATAPADPEPALPAEKTEMAPALEQPAVEDPQPSVAEAPPPAAAPPTPPVTLEPTPAQSPSPAPRPLSRLNIVLAWQQIRRYQRSEIEQVKLWKKFRCSEPGCKKRIVARDEKGWVCEQHCPTLHEPPAGWLPPR